MSDATERRFIQCDVFTGTPSKGNALAVVLDGEGLSDDQMQTFAAWTNLAETTFLFPPTNPDGDYGVRIFTPAREMPFAGHPTLGSCAAWLHAGGTPQRPGLVRQQCNIGIVEIDQTGAVPAFAAPPTRIEPMPEDTLTRILGALGINRDRVRNAARLENGPEWEAIELASADDVLAANAVAMRFPDFQGIGLIGPHPEGFGPDYEVRMLGASSGMSEDPITGSLNAALACWLDAQNRLPDELLIRQGTCIGREGHVHIRRDDTRILIGGATHIMIEGTLTF